MNVRSLRLEPRGVNAKVLIEAISLADWPHNRVYFADFAPRGTFPGQLTIRCSHFSSGRLVSQTVSRPRTETPASCTVSGRPDTSGCHQARSLPSATRR